MRSLGYTTHFARSLASSSSSVRPCRATRSGWRVPARALPLAHNHTLARSTHTHMHRYTYIQRERERLYSYIGGNARSAGLTSRAQAIIRARREPRPLQGEGRRCRLRLCVCMRAWANARGCAALLGRGGFETRRVYTTHNDVVVDGCRRRLHGGRARWLSACSAAGFLRATASALCV